MSSVASQICLACYSGVNVYEIEVDGVTVMRRCDDSWLNATQILEFAGFEKIQRQKIPKSPRKDQGIWVEFEEGTKLSQSFGVEMLIRPLLTYKMHQYRGVAEQVDTSGKEQVMAAQEAKFCITESKNNPTLQSRRAKRPARLISQSSPRPSDLQESSNGYSPTGGPAVVISDSHCQEPPRKRIHRSPIISLSQSSQDAIYAMPSPTVANESFAYQKLDPSEVTAPLARTVIISHEALLSLSTHNLNLPIDNKEHANRQYHIRDVKYTESRRRHSI